MLTRKLAFLTLAASLLVGQAAQAELVRMHSYTGGFVGSEIKVVKTDIDLANVGFVVGVKDSDGRLKLIGFTARHDGVERLADVRTGGVNPGGFALAAARGMVISAVHRDDGALVLISWDATSIRPVGLNPQIRRLETYTGGTMGYPGDLGISYMYTKGTYHRFAVLVRDSASNGKVIIFDVHVTTGAFVRRGEAVGGSVQGVHSIDMVYQNVVNENDPARLATAVTTSAGAMWIRVWFVDLAGNVWMGGSAGGGWAYDVHVQKIDRTSFLAAFTTDDARGKLVTFVMSADGTSLERGAEHMIDEQNRDFVPKLASCTAGGSRQFVVLRDRREELMVIRATIPRPQDIFIDDTNTVAGWVHVLDCDVVGSYVIAAVKNSDDNLMVIQYRH
jgi:hypothetical protein